MLWEDGEVYRISVLLACEQDCSDIMRRFRQIAQKKIGNKKFVGFNQGSALIPKRLLIPRTEVIVSVF